jgi:hypothetical protein
VRIAQTIGQIYSSFDPHHRSCAAPSTKLLSEGDVSKQLSRVRGKWLRSILAPPVSQVRPLRNTPAGPDIGFVINPLHSLQIAHEA